MSDEPGAGSSGRGWKLRTEPAPTGDDPDADVLGAGGARAVVWTQSVGLTIMRIMTPVAALIFVVVAFFIARSSGDGEIDWTILGSAVVASLGVVVVVVVFVLPRTLGPRAQGPGPWP